MTVEVKVKYDVDSRELSTATKKLEKMQRSTQGANSKAGKLTATLRKVAKGAAAVAVAVIATGVAMAKFTIAAVDAADKIAKSADKLGLTTKGYQELKFALGQVGISAEQFNIGFRRFSKTIGEAAQGSKSATDAFRAMGGSMKDFTGVNVDAEEAFSDTIDLLGQMEDKNEALAISMKVFGLAGQSFMLAAKAGADAIEELRDQASSLGIVIDEKLLRQSEEMGDKLSVVKQVVDAQWIQVWASWAPILVDLSSGFSSAAVSIAKFFGALGNTDMQIADSKERIAELTEQIALHQRVADQNANAHLGNHNTAIRLRDENIKWLKNEQAHLEALEAQKSSMEDREKERLTNRATGAIVKNKGKTPEQIAADAAAARKTLEGELQTFFRNLEGMVIKNEQDAANKLFMIAEVQSADIKERAQELLDNAQTTADEEVTIKRNMFLQLTEVTKAYEQGVADIEEAARKERVAKEKEEFDKTRTGMDHLVDSWDKTTQRMGDAAANWLNTASEGLTDFVMGGELDFQAFADSIIRDLIRIMIQKQLAGIFGAAFGFGLTAADGAVMSGGTPTPFAKGGVVGGPTTFPMSGGGTGLMGERGSEAIMPLQRGKDGKLGVAGGGGGGGLNIGTIVINVESNGQEGGHEQARRISSELEKMLRAISNEESTDQRRTGGMLNPTVISF